MYLTLQIIFYTPIVFALLYLLVNLVAKTPRNVCIVVLGDIGRSPRMQYHALSFVKEGFKVYIVGFNGSKPLDELLNHEQVFLHHLREPPQCLQYLPKLLTYVLKVIWQSVVLAWTLLLLPKTSSTLIQNPPSIPTMLVTYIVCRLRFSLLVIDWHNYGYSILALALKPSHLLVKFSKWYEKKCAWLSSYNICVTQAMREDLKENWNVRASTVYDRPPDIFKSISVSEQHQLFSRLVKEYHVFQSRDGSTSKTAFTQQDSNGQVSKLDTRPALLISSTSWTEDEDFGILLEMLQEYDSSSSSLPELICVITGKGPQKEYYKAKIEGTDWRKVKFCLPWLTAEDYPLLLGSADIGVCLHMSSSGLDLPMKVVDMFGCGLPVCAVNFCSIGELVQHQKNGLIFNNSEELLAQLKELLSGFPENQDKLEYYRENLKCFQAERWHDQWKQLVLPIFHEIGNDKSEVRDVGYKSGGGLPDDFDQIGATKPEMMHRRSSGSEQNRKRKDA